MVKNWPLAWADEKPPKILHVIMALRKHFSDVLKLSNLLNSIAAERISATSATFLCKKVQQHEAVKIDHLEVSSANRHHDRVPTLRTDLSSFNFRDNLLNMCERSATYEYKCPSSLTHKFAQLVILDKQIKSDYVLPLVKPIVTPMIDPLSQHKPDEIKDPFPSQQTPSKEAKEIMRIRHKKMKKHKLKKLRKRMYFVWRKQKLTRRAKRDAEYWKEINEIKKDGENFDAEDFVREQLQKARRGGYFVNVFGSKA